MLAEALYKEYVQILKDELVPAMGCTEPACVAYCASLARDVLEDEIVSAEVKVSGNIIKNVKGVPIPNAGGAKGMGAAVCLGLAAGQSDLVLECIGSVSDEQRTKFQEYLNDLPVRILPRFDGDVLDVEVCLEGKTHCSCVRIAQGHSNVVRKERDGVVLFEKPLEEHTEVEDSLSVASIVEFADCLNIEDVEDVLKSQAECNELVARAGLSDIYGSGIGHLYGDGSLRLRASALAAAGSDARMAGCVLPVVINSGSGNQGMAVSLPVAAYGKSLGSSEEALFRALAVSNLCAVHIKRGIGKLSAFCGAVSAGVSAGAGIAYLQGGGVDGVCGALSNGLGILSGVVCDGAKASCAAKVALGVDAGILGWELHASSHSFGLDEGILAEDVEELIRRIGQIGRVGLHKTDEMIVEMMCKDSFSGV